MTHKEKVERVIMKITSALVDMLMKLDPEKFKEYVVYEKGEINISGGTKRNLRNVGCIFIMVP